METPYLLTTPDRPTTVSPQGEGTETKRPGDNTPEPRPEPPAITLWYDPSCSLG